MEIETIYQNVKVSELTVKHQGDQYSASFEFTSTQGDFKVKLGGIKEVENLIDLLNAERLWVKEDSNSQLEYGRYTLGIQDEAYCEVIFDVLS